MRDLTEREEQVIWLVSKGAPTSEIAQTLFITQTTARNHVQNILNKTETHSRVAAVAAWRNWKPNHADRILNYCKDARIPVTAEQEAGIRELYRDPVRCTAGMHTIPNGEDMCECKTLSAAVPVP